MTPWEVLGVDPEASPAEVKKAWRKLALKHHPDQNPDDPEAEARFKEIQSAYDTLTNGAGVPVAGPGGDTPDDDWLDTLAWMTEHHARVVIDTLLPRYVAVHGLGYALGWALRDALAKRQLAELAPEVEVTPWARWRLRRRLRHVDVGISEARWAGGLVSLRKTHKGAQLLLEAYGFWRHAPRDEDDLRQAVFRTVELGLAGAIPMALGLRRLPDRLEAAQEADRLRWRQQATFRAVWGGVALLAFALVGTAWWSQR